MSDQPTEALRGLLDALASMHLIESLATVPTAGDGPITDELHRRYAGSIQAARSSLDELDNWLSDDPTNTAAPTIGKLAGPCHRIAGVDGTTAVLYSLDDGPRVNQTIGPLIPALDDLAELIEAAT